MRFYHFTRKQVTPICIEVHFLTIKEGTQMDMCPMVNEALKTKELPRATSKLEWSINIKNSETKGTEAWMNQVSQDYFR